MEKHNKWIATCSLGWISPQSSRIERTIRCLGGHDDNDVIWLLFVSIHRVEIDGMEWSGVGWSCQSYGLLYSASLQRVKHDKQQVGLRQNSISVQLHQYCSMDIHRCTRADHLFLTTTTINIKLRNHESRSTEQCLGSLKYAVVPSRRLFWKPDPTDLKPAHSVL
jgi:hypothetical protein